MVIENGEPDALLTRTLINSTSLSGPFILNSFLSRTNPPQLLLSIHCAKGPYAPYLGPGAPNVRHLIYLTTVTFDQSCSIGLWIPTLSDTYGLVVWGQKGWGMVNLLGIESPRPTSSLAIAEIVMEEPMQ